VTREEWLQARRQFLTASDVAAVLGEDERRGPFQVWAEKVHGYTQEELRIMRRGRRMEPVIAEEYVEETGRQVFEPEPYTLVVHPSIPWLASTLDRTTEGCPLNPAPAEGRAPLELKNVAGVKAADWREEPPTGYQIQLQIQLSCTGDAWGSLAAMIGGLSLAWKDLLRHERFLAAAFPRLEAFWLQVQRREAPEADGLPGTTEALKALYRDDDGETVALDAAALELADLLDAHRLLMARDKEQAQALQNKLRARMGTATFGALPDGSFLSLKKTEVEGYERKVEDFSYRRLRRFWPRLRRRA